MISRANKLILALLLLSIVCYLFYLNPDTVAVRFGRETLVSAPLAIVLLTTFSFGVVFTFFFAFIREMKGYWRERRLKDENRKREFSYKQMLKARAQLALGEFGNAENDWRNILNRNADDIVARIELSRSLEGDGDITEALKVIDAARAYDPTNLEVLFRAAELNLALGNKTAAIDNLALVLYHNPSAKAARMARDLSEALDRVEDALEYQRTLARLGYPGDDADAVVARLEFKQLKKNSSSDHPQLRTDLRKFVRSRPDFVPGLYELAQLELEDGNLEETSKLLLKAARVSKEPKYWEEAARLWIKAGQPDRAIAIANSGCDQVEGPAKVNSEIERIKLYLALNMNDEAKESITNLTNSILGSELESDENLARTLLILKGRCFNQLGDYRESAKVWAQLSADKFDLGEEDAQQPLNAGYHPPAPTLSTP